ncbi:MAG: hypothetical protein LQ344_001071 [Seirophora lacunosa]|nr:MAG: hypothetical protein LQ344_001071 [Seirophora lacunosa]
MTTPNPTSRAKQEAEFNRQYDLLVTFQAKCKTHLAALYRESRRLHALDKKVPEASVPDEDLDPRPNKFAPSLKDLVSPGDSSSDSGEEEGKQPDAWTLNWKRVLGAVDIDVNSLEDEIDMVEEENWKMRARLKKREVALRLLGRWGKGGNVVDLEGEAEEKGTQDVQQEKGAKVIEGSNGQNGEIFKKLAEKMRVEVEEISNGLGKKDNNHPVTPPSSHEGNEDATATLAENGIAHQDHHMEG